MKTKVGLAQVVLIMLIGRIIVIFTAAVSGGYTEAEMLSVLLGLPLILLLGIPILLFCARRRQQIGLLRERAHGERSGKNGLYRLRGLFLSNRSHRCGEI